MATTPLRKTRLYTLETAVHTVGGEIEELSGTTIARPVKQARPFLGQSKSNTFGPAFRSLRILRTCRHCSVCYGIHRCKGAATFGSVVPGSHFPVFLCSFRSFFFVMLPKISFFFFSGSDGHINGEPFGHRQGCEVFRYRRWPIRTEKQSINSPPVLLLFGLRRGRFPGAS